MREPTIAANYAETLFTLAQRANDLEGWGKTLDEVVGAVGADPRLQRFLETPQVSVDAKNAILSKAFSDRVPRHFLRFLQAVVAHRREHLLPDIAHAYQALVDSAAGRVHAQVSVAREPDAEERSLIARQLTRVTGQKVVPHFTVRPKLLGGVVVRIADTVMDGSVARRLAKLRERMLGRTAR